MITVDEEDKAAITEWAQHEGLTESKLLTKLVKAILVENGWRKPESILDSKKPQRAVSDRKT